jgi:Tfp pilus assembly protein PilN
MSVLETATALDTTVLLPGPPPLPRVNLLPPEIAERARFRRVQAGLGAGLLLTTGVVALLHVVAVGNTTEASAELAATTSRGTELRAQTTQFADVQRVHAEAAAATTMLAEAMSQEIRFSTLLDDLSRSVPAEVWLENVTFTQSATGPAAAAVGTPAGGVGSVSFTGTGSKHEDVATWLESLATLPRYADATFSKSLVEPRDGRPAVSFASSATLSTAALSRRYTAADGG